MYEALKSLWIQNRLTVEQANNAYKKGWLTLEQLNEIKEIPR